MKKLMFFAALASIAFASCSQEESLDNGNGQSVANAQTEITVNPFNRRMSRGYVTTAEFSQIDNPAATSPTEADRKMHISAYNTTDKTDYFIDKIFEKKTSGDVWGALDKPVYWPLAKTLDFLAYSQSDVQLAGTGTYKVPAILATWKSANEVELEVTKDSRQDDILYAAAWGLNANNSTSTKGFGMKFDHAQAWLTFKLSLTTGSEPGILKINSIRWKDVYESGMLTLKNEGPGLGQATATWDFFTQTPTDVLMDDPFKVLDTNEGDPAPTYEPAGALGTTAKTLNMLIPAQDHTGLVINYTMNGVTNEMEVAAQDFVNTGKTWAKGFHYIYNLAFTVNEITVAPTVNIWDEISTEWNDLGKNNMAYRRIVKEAAEKANALKVSDEEGAEDDGVTITYDNTNKNPINVSATANMEAFLSSTPANINDNYAFKAIKKFCDELHTDPVTFIYYKGEKYKWNAESTKKYFAPVAADDEFISGRLSLEASLATDFYPAIQKSGVAVAYISLNDEQTVVLTMKRTDDFATNIRKATDAIGTNFGTVLASNTGLLVEATAKPQDFVSRNPYNANDNYVFEALDEFLAALNKDYAIDWIFTPVELTPETSTPYVSTTEGSYGTISLAQAASGDDEPTKAANKTARQKLTASLAKDLFTKLGGLIGGEPVTITGYPSADKSVKNIILRLTKTAEGGTTTTQVIFLSLDVKK